MDNNTYLDVCLLLLLALNSEAVKNRWNEYFDKLYNDPHEVEDDVLLSFPSSRNEEEIPGIEEDEVTAAIAKMKNGKTPGIDNVTVEKLRAATKGLNFEDHTQIASKHLGNRGSTHHNSGSGQLLFRFTRNKINLTA